MIELILMLSLSGLNAGKTLAAAGPYQPCVWPNRCARPAQVAQFKPCVWPNRCASKLRAPVLAAGPFSTCVWPNRCRAEQGVSL